MEWFLITEIMSFLDLKKLHLSINTKYIHMDESNVPCGLHKYIGTDWIQHFPKSMYNININNSTGMPERQKWKLIMKIFFKDPFNLAVKCGHFCSKKYTILTLNKDISHLISYFKWTH